MNSKIYPILMIGILLVLFSFSGCGNDETTLDAGLSLDKSSITIDDGELSEFITATITKEDEGENNTVFVLKFPENKNNVYPTDVDGVRIYELQTKPIKGINSIDTLQFKIFGLNGEATEASYDLKVELWADHNHIVNQDKTIKIKVK